MPTVHLGNEVQVEAWILRTLVFTASRVIKRGHRPREQSLLRIMEVAEIPIPPVSPRGVTGGPSVET